MFFSGHSVVVNY